jgi:hypothetical protein
METHTAILVNWLFIIVNLRKTSRRSVMGDVEVIKNQISNT